MRCSEPCSIAMPHRLWLPKSGGACPERPPKSSAMFASFAGHLTAASARQLRVPVRCINGDLFPTDIHAIRQFLADFDAAVLPHTGHFPMLERPDEFNRKLAEKRTEK